MEKQKHDADYFYDVPVQIMDQRTSTTSLTKAHKDDGALGLLVSAYGDSSDSEEEDHKGVDVPISEGETSKYDREVACAFKALSFDTDGKEETRDGRSSDFNSQRLSCGKGKEVEVSHATLSCSTLSCISEQNRLSKGGNTSLLETALPFVPRSDDDSSRLHVFCLEHAAEVEEQLRPIGGIHIMLLCHPGNRKTTRFSFI